MYVSQKYKAVFLAIPKAASRSVSLWLKQEYGFRMRHNHHGINIKRRSRISNFDAFVIVRNPYSRLVSRWFQQHSRKDQTPYTEKRLLKRFYPSWINYVERLDYHEVCEENTSIYCEIYLTPQWFQIKHIQKHYEKPVIIIQQENLIDGLSKLPFVQLPINLPSKGRHEYGDWKRYYRDPSIRGKVYNYYKPDFDNLGYDELIQ